ncbi:MAG: B12-binding domain-containing radical SAM protein, partial [Firmicutes bacterium HGW-Firmicutes-3]
MRVLLIRPWVNKNITTVKNFLFGEPLGIECVSTVLKELGHEVLLLDCMIEKNASIKQYLSIYRPDMVGITSQCTDVENVLKIADIVKKYDSKIVVAVGGVQATCFPDSFFSPHVDYVYKSTTRQNLSDLMKEVEGTRSAEVIEGIYSRALDFINEGEFCFNEYIVPDREVTKRYRKHYQYIGFQPCAIVQTAYGCRNKCTFCVRWKLEGDSLREVGIEEIVDQIEALDEPYVMICDNDFLVHEDRLIEFCSLLEARNIKKKYMCYGSVNSVLEKPGLMKRLAKNGIMAVIIGYEAFDDSRLVEYNKQATTDQNEKVTRILQDSGIACWGSFIIHPDWEKKDFKRLLAYI